MTLQEVFAPQLTGSKPLAEAFFNPPEETPKEPRQHFGSWTDEEWAIYRDRLRTNGRTTHLGKKYEVGDIILFAIVHDHKEKGPWRYITCFADSELGEMEGNWRVLPPYTKEDGTPVILPVLVKLENGRIPPLATRSAKLPITD